MREHQKNPERTGIYSVVPGAKSPNRNGIQEFRRNSAGICNLDKKVSLASLLFLKEKRDGKIKARACADGQKQRETTAQDEAALPTVSIESVFVTATVEAKEGRDVAVINLSGAFLHANCSGTFG
jgi:hypothetical protein